jgi:hypothetical protein
VALPDIGGGTGAKVVGVPSRTLADIAIDALGKVDLNVAALLGVTSIGAGLPVFSCLSQNTFALNERQLLHG